MTKKRSNKRFTDILGLAGVIMIALAFIMLIFSVISENIAEKNADKIVEELIWLMPEIENGAPDGRFNTVMPALQIDENDFCAIIELPSFGVCLPVYNEWNPARVTKYPCRYMGSIYDGSLIIGGSDNRGQFDFMRDLSMGDSVYITDVTGLRFSLTVKDIRQTNDISTDYLTSRDADFVFFARNTYSLDYTVVRCDLSGT